MQPVSESVISALELAVNSGTPDVRTKMLRQVTDLFLADADRLSDEQVKVFDDVLLLLIDRIESQALAEVSKRLAPIDNAPMEAIRRLARDDEIVVAGPVLAVSKRLSTADLTEIAGTKSQAHLLAISGREELEEAVTDVLVDRGNRDVAFKLAGNAGAHFSQTGLSMMAEKADGDDGLTERMALRRDVPARLLRELLARASDAVRSKVLAAVPASRRDEIRHAIAQIADRVGDAAAEGIFCDADLLVRAMQARGALDETALRNFADEKKYEEMTVALSLLCGTPSRRSPSLWQVCATMPCSSPAKRPAWAGRPSRPFCATGMIGRCPKTSSGSPARISNVCRLRPPSEPCASCRSVNR